MKRVCEQWDVIDVLFIGLMFALMLSQCISSVSEMPAPSGCRRSLCLAEWQL